MGSWYPLQRSFQKPSGMEVFYVVRKRICIGGGWEGTDGFYIIGNSFLFWVTQIYYIIAEKAGESARQP